MYCQHLLIYSFDMRNESKEKIDSHNNLNNLKYEILKVWERLAKKVITVPRIIESLGCCAKTWQKSCKYWIMIWKQSHYKKHACSEQQAYFEKYRLPMKRTNEKKKQQMS